MVAAQEGLFLYVEVMASEHLTLRKTENVHTCLLPCAEAILLVLVCVARLAPKIINYYHTIIKIHLIYSNVFIYTLPYACHHVQEQEVGDSNWLVTKCWLFL